MQIYIRVIKGRKKQDSLFGIADMLFKHYPGIPRIIREEQDIDPERVACRREIEDGSQLFT